MSGTMIIGFLSKISLSLACSNSRTTPLQINSQSIPRLDPIDSKSSYIFSLIAAIKERIKILDLIEDNYQERH